MDPPILSARGALSAALVNGRLGVTRPRTADCHSPSHPARTVAPKDCDMEDLIMAALSGDDVRVSQLLDAGADVNHADENGWTVLTSAAIARRTR